MAPDTKDLEKLLGNELGYDDTLPVDQVSIDQVALDQALDSIGDLNNIVFDLDLFTPLLGIPAKENVDPNISPPAKENVDPNISSPAKENVDPNILPPAKENEDYISPLAKENEDANISSPAKENVDIYTPLFAEVDLFSNSWSPAKEKIDPNNSPPAKQYVYSKYSSYRHIIKAGSSWLRSPWNSALKDEEKIDEDLEPVTPEYKRADKYYEYAEKPHLFSLVNPRKVFGFSHGKRIVMDVNLNKGNGEDEVCFRSKDEVHVDHSYFLSEKKAIVEMPVPEAVIDEPQARRPVGRPRKCREQVKRYAEDMDEEIVDVESIQVKRARYSKPAASAAPKRRGRKPNSEKINDGASTSKGQPASYAMDANGFVMRQAKNSAMKKIAKAKTIVAVSPRSKRRDHNDMERRRRFEMRQLFEQLKALVPPILLKDKNGKYKKNPSKNTILNGARLHCSEIQEECRERNLLIQERAKAIKKIHKVKKVFSYKRFLRF